MDAEIADESERSLDATELGRELAKQYYTVLNNMPDQAWRFYAKRGNYRAVYEDGSVAVANDRFGLYSMLLRRAAYNAHVTSVMTVPCGSLDRLLVLITGERFAQTFLVEYQPGKRQNYAIVASIVKYLPGTVAVTAAADRRLRPPA